MPIFYDIYIIDIYSLSFNQLHYRIFATNSLRELKYGGGIARISPNVFAEQDGDGRSRFVIGCWDTGAGAGSFIPICI